MDKKIALVLEGGGLRGIFTAGVLDCFLDKDINFDYVCGVSAGACNTFAYVGKAKKFIRNSMIQKNPFNSFYGVPQMIESHKFVDLDKVFDEYATMYNFDYQKFLNNPIDWEMVVSNINTGKPEYLHANSINKVKTIGKASCSLPILTKPVSYNGNLYLDGGICDSVPVQRALDKGYDKVVVICTRKKGNYSKVKAAEKPIYKRLYSKYPNFLKAVFARNELYKKQIQLCEKLEKEGKVILIRPTMLEVSRLESDQDELTLAYYHGYTKAKEYVDKIRRW